MNGHNIRDLVDRVLADRGWEVKNLEGFKAWTDNICDCDPDDDDAGGGCTT